MGSKHSPPKWWLQGAFEEEAAEIQRRRDERWDRESAKHALLLKAFEEDALEMAHRAATKEWLYGADLPVEKHYIPPSTAIVDEFSMGCMVRYEPCGICQKDECPHMYQQRPPPLTEQQKIDQDVLLFGSGFGMLQDDGTIKHIPARKVLVFSNDKHKGPRGG
jgi:hypothetical protein